MKINDVTLEELASALSAERKRQKLSREDLAAVCGVSTSFIRDAESNPENCTLGKLMKLINGLGLSLDVSGQAVSPRVLAQPYQRPSLASQVKRQSQGRVAASLGLRQPDFGVPDSQLVRGLTSLTPERDSKNKTLGEAS
jgi:HTH-type transcriptional regulator/antitoxin HipB